MIEPERVQSLNDCDIQSGKYILYWMQASQRIRHNHALGYSIQQANQRGLPVLVYFGLTTYPSANERSYTFMLQGLRELEKSLLDMGAGFISRVQSPDEGAISLAKEASIVVVDRDYQKLQKSWRFNVAKAIKCPLIQVESNVVVPIELVSLKEEYTAGTLRPKLHRHLDRFLTQYRLMQIKHSYSVALEDSLEFTNIQSIIDRLGIDQSVQSVDWLTGGYHEASIHLRKFLRNKIDGFNDYRNDPALDYSSNMSPYLHFGQISPLEIALSVLESGSPSEESYLEELIVRRELSMNFVNYNPDYMSIDCLPNWAKTTLEDHKSDSREYIYDLEEFEEYKTHDPYWNAAQRQMVEEGKMHGYMRMYWGKKIIEWTKTPEEAYAIAIYLNDKYELDGRDPNGYAGVAWCFGKHDRAWKERNIFGKIRYMNDKGLRRKFDIDTYARRYGF